MIRTQDAMGRTYSMHERERRHAYRVLMGMPEGKRSLGRPRHRWEDNIKIVLREIGRLGMDWIDLAEDKGQGGLL
jgi:hypothetical protein